VADKQAVLDQLKSKYAEVAAIDELDGVTIDAFDAHGWWFNVRASNTEPLLRLNAEAADPRKLAALLQEIQPLLGTPAEGH
jgi:phosphomannomutase